MLVMPTITRQYQYPTAMIAEKAAA